jgi:SAM-dependent methyltransferase
MSWRKLLLLPTLIKLGSRAPRSLPVAWEHYWQGVRDTGAGGDVLWDAAHDGELRFCVEKTTLYGDGGVPWLDVGCGNGRFTRMLGAAFGRALGVDVSPSAIERARLEGVAGEEVTYRCLDVTASGWGKLVHDELGDVNVFVRGVLHILAHREKVALVENLRELLGQRGTLFLLETAFQGSPLDYLEFLGARNGTLPAPLAQLIGSGLPQPSSFAAPELARYFPAPAFRVLESGPAPIFAVGMHPGSEFETIPGYYAALRLATNG